ncbi:Hsp20-type molecular chaperone [Natronomonas moolapensis 8.8.11]|jgi:HSP20 family molecular chaperone IbpA|uniref:Hsp20-type molecular chaperone n=1 Tax=Natronomonas moolapensis (strain DSM 18674 / CECT 7526 / JCM 14361 / 8.8.11) TaxID=268739 RepID=M1XQZ7_NATM8|nr:Hsp20 family protein [Natronomonas moolapensis]CCQ36609.1 Hsp20-type molecular chaperone [Natronomonas moolapensis 8.8.11]
MIRKVGASLGRVIIDGIGRATSRLQERTSLPADLLESDEAYLAVFDAPGAIGDDVSVHFEDDTLSVRIDRFREFHDGYEMRFPGRGLALDGEVALPDGASIDAGRAEAALTRAGTLEVVLPKVEVEAETDADHGGETAIDTDDRSDGHDGSGDGSTPGGPASE